MLTIPFIAMVLLTFVTLVAVPCNIIALPLEAYLARTRPQARSPLLLLLIAAPWLLGGGVLISSVVDVLFGACDMGSVCLWNEDPMRLSPGRALIVLPLLAGLATVGIRLGRQLLASRMALHALQRSSVYDPAANAYVLPSPVALAFAARGRVFVSHALQAGLSAAQYQAVLLHERAHLHRSDGLCTLLARALSCTLVPPVRRRILNALTLANEQSADEAAGQVVGRLQIAHAILAAERLCGSRSVTLSPAFAESFVPDRVRALLAPPPPSLRSINVYAATGCGVLSVFLVGDLLYYVSMLLLYPGSVS